MVWYWWRTRHKDKVEKRTHSYLHRNTFNCFEEDVKTIQWMKCFSMNGAGAIGHFFFLLPPFQMKNPSLNFPLHTKIDPKWIINLHMKYKIIKILEKMVEENF